MSELCELCPGLWLLPFWWPWEDLGKNSQLRKAQVSSKLLQDMKIWELGVQFPPPKNNCTGRCHWQHLPAERSWTSSQTSSISTGSWWGCCFKCPSPFADPLFKKSKVSSGWYTLIYYRISNTTNYMVCNMFYNMIFNTIKQLIQAWCRNDKSYGAWCEIWHDIVWYAMVSYRMINYTVYYVHVRCMYIYNSQWKTNGSCYRDVHHYLSVAKLVLEPRTSCNCLSLLLALKSRLPVWWWKQPNLTGASL